MGFIDVPQAAQPFTLATAFNSPAAERFIHPGDGSAASSLATTIFASYRVPSAMTLRGFRIRNGGNLGVADDVSLEITRNGIGIAETLVNYPPSTPANTLKGAAGVAITLAAGDVLRVHLINNAGAYVQSFTWEISLEPIV